MPKQKRSFDPLKKVDPMAEAPYTGCHCYKCLETDYNARPNKQELIFAHPVWLMILCQKCGNKRCPHAADHELACTNSNEPGQKGSLYE